MSAPRRRAAIFTPVSTYAERLSSSLGRATPHFVPRERPVVALDGPSGAGKSTVARRVAEALGYALVDTGAIYRSVALAAKRAGLAWNDASAVSSLATELVAKERLVLSESPSGGARVVLDGEDVSSEIRTPDVSLGASAVSAIPAVRAALLDWQRKQAERGGVVLEGRDIGTVVVPDAEAKFFVTASAEVRARRRWEELRGRGVDVTFERTLADVERRDHADSSRTVAPLVPAADAEILDTSAMSIDDVVAHIVTRVRALAP